MTQAIEADTVTQMLAFIRDFSDQHHCGPSVREIGAHVGVRSSATVHKYLARLAQSGYITSLPNRARTLRLTVEGREAVT
jgi:repressor LexA